MSFRIIAALILCLSLVACAQPRAERIVVQKSERKMVLIGAENKVLGQYKIALGPDPIGHKVQEGDGKTPEGLYYIKGHNLKSKYYKSLRISYPNETDRALARAQGTSPGGDIMIHGLGKGVRFGTSTYARRQGDWTHGCIAVTNREIDEIWQMVGDGTPIIINP